MTNEQIIALVKEYFQEGGIRDDGGCCEWFATTDTVLKFAKAIQSGIYNEGYFDGCADTKRSMEMSDEEHEEYWKLKNEWS